MVQSCLTQALKPSGNTKVSTVSPKQGSGTVSTINGNVVTVSPFSNNCYKEGQWLTVNKTVNVDPKTDKINAVNNTIITVNGVTDLDQFAAGDSVFMTDNSTDSASTKTGYKLTTTDIESVGSTYVGITDQVPEGSTGNWTGILGLTPSNTSGPSATLPDGGAADSTPGRFYWTGLNVGDSITIYCTTPASTREGC